MRTFAINLDYQPEKKEFILNEGRKAGIDIEIISGISGKDLTEEQLSEMVVDHENNCLGKGGIGASLSHVKVYKKIIDENIPMALILEDDAVFLDKANTAILEIESFDDSSKPNVYLLTPIDRYYVFLKYKAGTTTLRKVYRSFKSIGYIVNNAAARLLYENLYPVQYESDFWENFIILFGINVYGVVPSVISTNDLDKSNSVMEPKRKALMAKRRAYRSKLLASKPGFTVKRLFRRSICRLFARLSKEFT